MKKKIIILSILILGSVVTVRESLAEKAREIYNQFLEKMSETGVPFETGEFQEWMQIYSENDGPVNLIIES